MLSFAPLDGVDSCYDQLYRPFNSDTYTLGGIEAFPPHNLFKDFKFCPEVMRVATALPSKSCPSNIPLLVMPCLIEFNEWMLEDQDDDWTEDELEAAIFPPSSPYLDIWHSIHARTEAQAYQTAHRQ
jgi:hypothetical protein